MKILLTIIMSTSVLLMVNDAYSHSPELHKKEGAEKPQCEALQKADQSKKDVNDPIRQALLIQCKEQLHHEEDSEKQEHHDNKESHGQKHHG